MTGVERQVAQVLGHGRDWQHHRRLIINAGHHFRGRAADGYRFRVVGDEVIQELGEFGIDLEGIGMAQRLKCPAAEPGLPFSRTARGRNLGLHDAGQLVDDVEPHRRLDLRAGPDGLGVVPLQMARYAQQCADANRFVIAGLLQFVGERA